MTVELPPDRNGLEHQVEFPPEQTHLRSFERFILGFSILCVIIVLVIVLGTDIGNLNR